MLDRRELRFAGFTREALRVIGGKVYVAPDSAKRLQASKVLDADAHFWKD